MFRFNFFIGLNLSKSMINRACIALLAALHFQKKLLVYKLNYFQSNLRNVYLFLYFNLASWQFFHPSPYDVHTEAPNELIVSSPTELDLTL